MKTILKALLITIVLASSNACRAAVVFFDSNMNTTGWTAGSLVTGVGGTFSRSSVGSGGFPGSYMRFDTTVYNGFTQREQLVYTYSNSATYDPSLGAFTGLDVELSAIILIPGAGFPPGHEYGIALAQGGKNYFAHLDHATSTWTTTALHLDAQSFQQFHGAPNDHPDFSASGAPITFGFDLYSANNAVNLGDQVLASGFDNWKITLTVPEPSRALLIIIGGSLLLCSRQRLNQEVSV
jgi:hypothetical protein